MNETPVMQSYFVVLLVVVVAFTVASIPMNWEWPTQSALVDKM